MQKPMKNGMSKPTKSEFRTFFMGLVWVLVLVLGFSILLTYSGKPGAVGSVPTDWPKDSIISRDDTASSLILFAHPKCPCTRATASELDRLLAKLKGVKINTYVFLYKPKGSEDSWTKTELRKQFESIVGTKVLVDEDGLEAEKFGAKTSGQALLYSRDGNLLFKGGITPARGHEGDSLGKDSIVALLTTGKSQTKATPVFGCSIRKPASIGWKTE